jgi:hypothetical protein
MEGLLAIRARNVVNEWQFQPLVGREVRLEVVDKLNERQQ